MSEQFERLVTVWDANFAKLDEKLNRINARHHAVSRQLKKDADSFTAHLQKRYGAAGQAFGNIVNDSRLAVLDTGASHLRVFGSALEPLGPAGLAAAAGIAALAVAGQQAIEAMRFADEIDDAAQKLNIGTDALQEFRFAMTEVGGEAADADAAIESFNKKLGEAQAGGRAKKWFDALGVDDATLNSWSSFEDAIPRLSRSISELGKESERAAVVEKIGLGAMLPLLREGQDEMEALRQKARDLGIVMDADLVAKGAEANQQFETMSSVIKVQLTTAFVELSDEVVGFVSVIADALTSLNAFIERAQAMKANLGGFGFGDGIGMPTAAGLVKGGFRLVRGAVRGPQVTNFPTIGDMEALLAPQTTPAGTGLGDISRGGRSGGRGRDTADQRARRQEQFDRELERLQQQLLRAYDHEFESIESEAGNKLRQLEAEHAESLADIVRREKEYLDNDGLRGISAAEAEQLRAAQEELRAYGEAQILWEERRALDEYRLRLEEEAADAILRQLGVERDLAITARDRHVVERRILAARLQMEREAQKAALADDPNIDDVERSRRLAEGDRLRQGEYDALGRSGPGGQLARDVAEDIAGERFDPEAQAEAMAEVARLEAEGVLSHEEAVRAKAEIDAHYYEQRIQRERGMLDTLASLQTSSNAKLRAIGKAAALAQAVLDAKVAIQKAWASAPFPANLPAVAITTAATAANIAAIAGFEEGGYTGNGGRKKIAGYVHGQEYVFDADATRRIGVPALDALRSGSPLIGALGAATSGIGGMSPDRGGDSITFAPVINAPGADMAAVRQMRAMLDEQRRSFASDVKGVMARQQRFRKGTR